MPSARTAYPGDNPSGNKIALAAFITGLIQRDGIAPTIGGPQPFPLPAQIVRNHCVGRVQNRLRGTIILLKTDGPTALVLLFKVENILDGGTAEPVDALVIVADHTDIFVPACQQGGQQILHMVGVLIFVHQNIPKFPLIILLYVLVLLKKPDRYVNDIVKVQSVVILQTCLIFCVAPGDMQGPQIAAGFRTGQHFLRGHHLVLFPADRAKNVLCGKGLVIQPHVLDDVLHDPLRIRRIINGKAAGIPHFFNVPPQNTAAGGMKGHGPDILCLGAKQG